MSSAALVAGPTRNLAVLFDTAVADNKGLSTYGAPDVAILNNRLTTHTTVSMLRVRVIRALQLKVICVSADFITTNVDKLRVDFTRREPCAFKASIQGIVCHYMGYAQGNSNTSNEPKSQRKSVIAFFRLAAMDGGANMKFFPPFLGSLNLNLRESRKVV
jgi:hypothetical protein